MVARGFWEPEVIVRFYQIRLEYIRKYTTGFSYRGFARPLLADLDNEV